MLNKNTQIVLWKTFFDNKAKHVWVKRTWGNEYVSLCGQYATSHTIKQKPAPKHKKCKVCTKTVEKLRMSLHEI